MHALSPKRPTRLGPAPPDSRRGFIWGFGGCSPLADVDFSWVYDLNASNVTKVAATQESRSNSPVHSIQAMSVPLAQHSYGAPCAY